MAGIIANMSYLLFFNVSQKITIIRWRMYVATLFIAGVLLDLSCPAFAGDIKNYALDASYSYKPLPNYALSKDRHDSKQLTDGRYTTGRLWANKEAVGWKQSGNISISIDLSKNVFVEKMCVNSASGHNSDVYFPSNIEMFLTKDAKQYEHVGNLIESSVLDNGKYKVHKFCLDGIKAHATEVLFLVRPSGHFGFFFSDEIEVYGTDEISQETSKDYKTYEVSSLPILFEKLVLFANKKKAFLRNVSNFRTTSANELNDRINELSSDLIKSDETNDNVLESYQTNVLAVRQRILAKLSNNPLIIWQPDPWKNISLFDLPENPSSTVNALSFDLMVNGTASNAFIMTNNTPVANTYKVKFYYNDLKLENLPKITINEVVPVVANNHTIVLDAIKSLDSKAVILRPGESKQLWISVNAAGVLKGDYYGKVYLEAVSDSDNNASIPINMKVWDVTLPYKKSLSVNAWAYFNWGPIRDIKKLAAKDLDDHHVNVSLLHPSQIPWPVFSQDGSMSIDFSSSDQLMNLQSKNMWLFYLELNSPHFRAFGGKYKYLSKQWKNNFMRWIKAWKDHLKRNGFNKSQFAFYPYDEPSRKSHIREFIEVSKLIKSHDQNMLVYTTLGKLAGAQLVEASKYVDIFQIVERDVEKVKNDLAGRNKRIWLYTTNGGKMASPIGEYRLQGWKAFENNVSGIGFWAYADDGWRGTVWNDFDARKPDYSVIYKSNNIYAPQISSKRWEAWREGVEDYELLKIVEASNLNLNNMVELRHKVRQVIKEGSNSKMLISFRKELLHIGAE
ncbi:MAG: hypothetical protein ABW168_27450 [Sedimenticola sp.]